VATDYDTYFFYFEKNVCIYKNCLGTAHTTLCSIFLYTASTGITGNVHFFQIEMYTELSENRSPFVMNWRNGFGVQMA
jgi:hypothetical protein